MSCSCATFLTAQSAPTCAPELASNFLRWTGSNCAYCGYPLRRELYGSESETTRCCTSAAETPRGLSMANRHTATSLPVGASEVDVYEFGAKTGLDTGVRLGLAEHHDMMIERQASPTPASVNLSCPYAPV